MTRFNFLKRVQQFAFSAVLIVLCPSSTMADMAHSVSGVNEVGQITKLLMLPQQRQKIAKERQKYLATQAKELHIQAEAPPILGVKKGKGRRKQAKPVTLNSVVMRSDGRAIVVINHRWLQGAAKSFRYEIDPGNTTFIWLVIDNKRIRLPVGATYDPNTGRIKGLPKVSAATGQP